VVTCNDPLNHPEFFKTPGDAPQSMLCLPIQNGKGEMIGVLQFVNKRKNTALNVGKYEGFIRR